LRQPCSVCRRWGGGLAHRRRVNPGVNQIEGVAHPVYVVLLELDPAVEKDTQRDKWVYGITSELPGGELSLTHTGTRSILRVHPGQGLPLVLLELNPAVQTEARKGRRIG